MPNLIDNALNTAEAVGLYTPINTSPNFQKIIRKLDPYQGYSLEYLRQFASESSLLEFKTEWLELKEESLRRTYGNFAYLTPMSNTFIVDKNISGKYVVCYAGDHTSKIGSYTIDSSYFYKSDATKIVKPTYKDLTQKDALIFANNFGDYLDFYDSVSKLKVVEGTNGDKWEFYSQEETHPSFPNNMPLIRKVTAKPKDPSEVLVTIRLLHLYNEKKKP